MAHLVKCFLCIPENGDSTHVHAGWISAIPLYLQGRDRGLPKASWLVSLDKLGSLGSTGRHYSIKNMASNLGRLPTLARGFHNAACKHMCIHTQTHIQCAQTCLCKLWIILSQYSPLINFAFISSLTLAILTIRRAWVAYLSVLSVSSMLLAAGLMVAIIAVLEFPPRLSFRSL